MVDNGRLILKNVSVYYGQNQVLKNISLNIPDKSLTVIIGPSGCGKSTLLKSLNRLLDEVEEARVEGQILLDNQNIYGRDVDVTQIRKRWAYYLRSRRFYPCRFMTI